MSRRPPRWEPHDDDPDGQRRPLPRWDWPPPRPGQWGEGWPKGSTPSFGDRPPFGEHPPIGEQPPFGQQHRWRRRMRHGPWRGGPWDDRTWRREWFSQMRERRSRSLFWRFALIFGLIMLLIVGGMALLVFVITRLLEGTTQSALLIWIAGCSLSLAFPIIAAGVAVRAFHDIARPLGSVMSAADAVADGDLSVRIPEGRGEFGRLAYSFNRMVGELERADEQRRNLTTDVAHELRTPLHILQGEIEGLIDGVYQPTPEHFNAMLDETHLLSRLVEDLRTLSLAESGHLPLHREALTVLDLLSDVATSFSGPAESAGVVLRIDAASIEGVTLDADPARMNQVLGNLVANALRYTPEGGTITLRAERNPDGVRLFVADTGVGIAAEELPYIFDRFWKGDRSRSREGGGSGLGLAIARQLVHLHDGRIEVMSTTGQGTTFIIDLPVST